MIYPISYNSPCGREFVSNIDANEHRGNEKNGAFIQIELQILK